MYVSLARDTSLVEFSRAQCFGAAELKRTMPTQLYGQASKVSDLTQHRERAMDELGMVCSRSTCLARAMPRPEVFPPPPVLGSHPFPWRRSPQVAPPR